MIRTIVYFTISPNAFSLELLEVGRNGKEYHWSMTSTNRRHFSNKLKIRYSL